MSRRVTSILFSPKRWHKTGQQTIRLWMIGLGTNLGVPACMYYIKKKNKYNNSFIVKLAIIA